MIIKILILILFSLSGLATGYAIMNRLREYLEYPILRFVAAFLFGSLVSVSFTYALAAVLPAVWDRFLISPILYAVVSFGFSFMYRKRLFGGLRQDFMRALGGHFDLGVAGVLLCFAIWLMFKSFRMGTASTLLIGSNEVFDFGHALSIVRSFSLGDNIPFLSPFVAGAVHVYHFMYYFWVGMLEHLGLPIVWAMNLPSALTYACMLMIVYYLPLILMKTKKIVGLLAVLFTVMHATLTFIFFFVKFGFSIHTLEIFWHLPKYFFAGPFDGSPISIYWTLNVFVNQRHLAMGISMALIIVYLAFRLLETKKINYVAMTILTILTGLTAYWHIVMFGIALGTVMLFLAVRKQWKLFGVFLTGACLVAAPTLAIWIRAAQIYVTPAVRAGIPISRTTNIPVFLYVLYNYGALLLTVPLGFLVIPRKTRMFFAAGILIFAAGIAAKVLFRFDIDQKFGNYTVLYANVLSAYGLLYIWQKKSSGYRIAVIVAVLFLILSGIIDLSVIKNDFAYPVTDAPKNTFMTWIEKNTKPDAVFAAPPDIFDPVTLAGRRNYYGFFRNPLVPDRSSLVKQIYENPLQVKSIEVTGIHYIVIPNRNLPDFRYTVDRPNLFTMYRVAFSDENVSVLAVH